MFIKIQGLIFLLFVLNFAGTFEVQKNGENSIQDAVNMAAQGDTVLIPDGLYYEAVNFSGKAITIASYFIIDGDSSHIKNTILSKDGQDTANPSIIYFTSNEDSNSVLYGLTIAQNAVRNMDATITFLSTGSAVYAAAGGKISHCVLRNNTLKGSEPILGGAALYVENNGSKVFVLDNNHIYQNTVYNNGNAEGGAVRINHANCSIRNNKFEDNLLIGKGGYAKGAAVAIHCTLGLSPPNFIELYGNEMVSNRLISKLGVESYGGAVSVYNTGFVIKHNLFSNNFCENQSSMVLGSALHIDRVNDSSILENNTFHTNDADANTACFGTVSLQNSSKMLIRSNTISANSLPAGYGGAVFLHNVTDTDLINNCVKNNEAYGIGGIYIEQASVNMHNNVITGNRALKSYAGGIYVNASYGYPGKASSPLEKIRGTQNTDNAQNSLFKSAENTIRVKLINNSITNNTAQTSGGGLSANGALEITNCIFWGNNAASEEQLDLESDESLVTYNNIEGGYAGSGNIAQNPVFISEENCYLDPQLSPCVDAGHFLNLYNDPEDPQNPGFALYPSLGTIRNDMGAWGGPRTNGSEYEVKTEEISYGKDPVMDGLYLNNYPNPFNPRTVINYKLPAANYVELNIYNTAGQRAAVLISKMQPAGSYEVDWDASGKPSGLYFVELRTNNFREIRRILLLK